MATAINEQHGTEENIPTLDTLSEMLNGIISRVRFAAKRVSGDDVFKSALTNIENDITLLASEISDLLGYEADQYNALVDKYQNLEANMALARSALADANAREAKHEEEIKEMRDGCEQIVKEEQNRAQNAINIAERNAHKWETAYNAQVSQVTALKAVSRTQLQELRNLRAMEPEKLKKKYFDEKKKTTELTATVKDLQTKHNQAAREVVSLKGRTADIEARNHILGEDLEEMRARMDLIDGEHCVHGIKFYSPQNKGVVFYPHIFLFSLHISVATANDHDGIRFINNLDFHIMIRNTIGIETTYRISELGYPLCKIAIELLEHWPDDMDDFVYDFILEQLERTNPHLHKRCVWARETLVEDLPIAAPARQALIAEGIDTLAKLGSTYAHQFIKIKGIGPETITKIQIMVREMISQWNKENGAPEVERKDLPTRQKIMDRRVAELTKVKLKELNGESNAA